MLDSTSASDQGFDENEYKSIYYHFSQEDRETISKKLFIATNTTNYYSIVLSLKNGSYSKLFLSYYLMTKYCSELENTVV